MYRAARQGRSTRCDDAGYLPSISSISPLSPLYLAARQGRSTRGDDAGYLRPAQKLPSISYYLPSAQKLPSISYYLPTQHTLPPLSTRRTSPQNIDTKTIT